MKRCSCGKKAVIDIRYLKKSFCGECFKRFIERKVRKNIRKHKLILPNEKVGVAVSGGKDSLTTLYLIKKICKQNEVICITIDEGIKGYREKTLEKVRYYCNEWGIDYFIFSYKKEFGMTLDEMVKKLPKFNPCSICGVFRRYLINKKASELGCSKLVTGHNLDDESQGVLMNIFLRNISTLLRQGWISGISTHKKFISRVKPLRNIGEREVYAYFLLNGFKTPYITCPYSISAFRLNVGRILNWYESSHPGTKINILKTADKIIQKLRKFMKGKKMKKCKRCGWIAIGDICKACEILSLLKK